jgi:hypothetical protein
MAKKKINARSKGSAGEREFVKWLTRTLLLKVEPTRNLEQVRKGGADIIDLSPFVFEVKRCEVLKLRDWWAKVCVDTPHDIIPVVAFRQNFKPWSFLISARFIGLEKGFIQLEEERFKEWVKYIYSENNPCTDP